MRLAVAAAPGQADERIAAPVGVVGVCGAAGVGLRRRVRGVPLALASTAPPAPARGGDGAGWRREAAAPTPTVRQTIAITSDASARSGARMTGRNCSLIWLTAASARRGRLARRRRPGPPAGRRSWRRTRPRSSRSASGGCCGLDGDVADVDDSRKLADAIEEEPEVVVRAFGLQLVRQLRVERFLLRRLRREALNRQVRLRRQPLDPAQDVGDVLLLRQHRAQVLEPLLELGDLRLELRQPARGRDALVDVRRAARSAASAAHRCRPALRSRRSSRSRTRRAPTRRRMRRSGPTTEVC